VDNYCVYMHIFPNGKKYIGIAKEDRLLKRWGSNGDGYLNNRQYAIENAIRKYGWENVRHEILLSGLSKSESKIAEIQLIKKYNTFGVNGYNMTPGGDDRTFMYGANNPSSRPVIYQNKEYATMNDFCKTFNLKMPTVSMWLNGKEPMPKIYYENGLHFKGEGMNHLYVQNGHPSGKNSPTAKAIYFNGVRYDTLKEFCKHYGVTKDTVRGWTIGRTAMPRYFYDGNLHYEGGDLSLAKRSKVKNKFDDIYTRLN